jgi:hypothetical protein
VRIELLCQAMAMGCGPLGLEGFKGSVNGLITDSSGLGGTGDGWSHFPPPFSFHDVGGNLVGDAV